MSSLIGTGALDQKAGAQLPIMKEGVGGFLGQGVAGEIQSLAGALGSTDVNPMGDIPDLMGIVLGGTPGGGGSAGITPTVEGNAVTDRMMS